MAKTPRNPLEDIRSLTDRIDKRLEYIEKVAKSENGMDVIRTWKKEEKVKNQFEADIEGLTELVKRKVKAKPELLPAAKAFFNSFK